MVRWLCALWALALDFVLRPGDWLRLKAYMAVMIKELEKERLRRVKEQEKMVNQYRDMFSKPDVREE